MSLLPLENYKNKITNLRRIFTAENLGDMSPKEFKRNEPAINWQLENLGMPSDNDLKNSTSVVFVEEYTRHDGTKVRSHYRSKPGKGTTAQNKNSSQPKEESFEDMVDKYSKDELGMQAFIDIGKMGIDALPDDWAAKPFLQATQARLQKYKAMLDEYKRSQEEEYDPNGENPILKTFENAVVIMSELSGEIMRNGIRDIDWIAYAKKANVVEILSMAHPYIGMAATIAVDIVPNIIKVVEYSKTGENKLQMYETILDLAESSTPVLVGIGQAIAGLPDRIKETKEVRATLRDLENVTHQAGKIESALYKKTAEEFSKGNQTGGASGIENTPKLNDSIGVGNKTPELSNTQSTIQPTKFRDIFKIKNTEPKTENSNFLLMDEDTKHAKGKEYQTLCNEADNIVRNNKIGAYTNNGYQVVNIEYDQNTNFKAVTYQKGNDVVICFVGTDFSNKQDIKANADMWKTGENKQFDKANEYYERNKNKYQGKITVIGHSEGGTEALFVAVKNDVRAYTFNAYGLHENLYENRNYTNQITNYRTSDDPVSKLRAPRGETYILQSQQNVAKKFLTPEGIKAKHQIDKMGQEGYTKPFEEAVPYDRKYRMRNPLYINNLSRVSVIKENYLDFLNSYKSEKERLMASDYLEYLRRYGNML